MNGGSSTDEVSSTQPNQPGAELDDMLEILSNHRRRQLWRVLRSRSEPISLSEAARHVAAREAGVAAEDVTRREKKSVYTSLYQHHVPLLAEANLVEFHEPRTAVSIVDNVEREYVVEAGLDSRDIRRSIGGSLLLGVGLVAGLWAAGIPVIGGLHPAGLAASLLVSTTALAVVYATFVRWNYRVRFFDVVCAVDGSNA